MLRILVSKNRAPIIRCRLVLVLHSFIFSVWVGVRHPGCLVSGGVVHLMAVVGEVAVNRDDLLADILVITLIVLLNLFVIFFFLF